MFSIAGSNAGIAIPIGAREFGYFSIAGIVTVPLGGTTKAFNGGDSSQFIGSVGRGFSY